VNRAIEQEIFLQHYADLAPKPGRINLGSVNTVNEDVAALGPIEALNEFRQRGFS
jgi:hypothetical protein